MFASSDGCNPNVCDVVTMPVSVGGGSSSNGLLQALLNAIQAISNDTDVFISELPPATAEVGDIWYKPSEDRYHVFA